MDRRFTFPAREEFGKHHLTRAGGAFLFFLFFGSRCNPELPLQMAAEAGEESAARCATPPWPSAESCTRTRLGSPQDAARVEGATSPPAPRGLARSSLLPVGRNFGAAQRPPAPRVPPARWRDGKRVRGPEFSSSPIPHGGARAMLTSPDGAVPPNPGKVGEARCGGRRPALLGSSWLRCCNPVSPPLSASLSESRGGRGGIKTAQTHARLARSHTHKSALNSSSSRRSALGTAAALQSRRPGESPENCLPRF